MIASSTWTNVIYRKCGNDCAIKIPFDVAKWIFVGCIIFGFVLVSPASVESLNLRPDLATYQLAYESWKARRVIRSRDIAFAFTNVMANDYYSLSKSRPLVGFEMNRGMIPLIPQNRMTPSASSAKSAIRQRRRTNSRSFVSSLSRVSQHDLESKLTLTHPLRQVGNVSFSPMDRVKPSTGAHCTLSRTPITSRRTTSRRIGTAR